jgi:endonuclease/exonuclease/phosphatase family metal-dependent hydrolase
MNLVTWNTQWCCGIDGTVSPQRIVDGVRRLADADVLCLQEIAVNYPRLRGNAGHDQPALLSALLPGYQLFFGAAIDTWTQESGRQQFGNVVATRLPVLQVQHHALPYPADAGVLSMPRMCTVVTVRDPALGVVRVMTTHLEFYSKVQRMAQAVAVRDLHQQASSQAVAPPKPCDDGSPFQTRANTTQAILCGDFNMEASQPEYAALTAPGPAGQLWDSWRLLHGDAPRQPTFQVHDRQYGPDPLAFDFVFVSDPLKDKVRRLVIDADTQASDHQPVLVEFGA